MAEPLAYRLACPGQLFGLRKLQYEHCVACLLEILRQRRAQPLGGLTLAGAQAIGERIEAVVDILNGRGPLLLQIALDHGRQFRLTLQHDADAVCDPQNSDQRERGQECREDGEQADFHRSSIPLRLSKLRWVRWERTAAAPG